MHGQIPPIEQRFCPPRGLVPSKTRVAERGLFWLKLVAACIATATISAAVTVWLFEHPNWIFMFASMLSVQAIAIGMVSALALYLYMLPDGQPIDAGVAARKTLAGGVFGLLAAKAGAGFGLNEQLQTAAAGVGGARGPKYLDKIAEKLSRG